MTKLPKSNSEIYRGQMANRQSAWRKRQLIEEQISWQKREDRIEKYYKWFLTFVVAAVVVLAITAVTRARATILPVIIDCRYDVVLSGPTRLQQIYCPKEHNK